MRISNCSASPCGLRQIPLRGTAVFYAEKSRRLLLIFFWLAGLCFGSVIGIRTGDLPSPAFYSGASGSFWSTFLALAFWPVVTFLLANFFPWQVLLLAAFFRGCILAFSWCVLSRIFTPVGWLFSPMSLLLELLMTPFLFLLWLQLLQRRSSHSMFVLLLCLAFAFLGSITQLYLVMPASAFLIEGFFQSFSA